MEELTDSQFCFALCDAARKLNMPMTRSTEGETVLYGFVEPLSGQRITGERDKDRVKALVTACKALQKYFATK